MSSTEWVLVALTILIPAIVATGVTLWTLEQVLKRSKKNRKKPASSDMLTTETPTSPDCPS